MKYEIEYCYSGFMGFPYVIFLWDGNVMVLAVLVDAEGKRRIVKGSKV